MFRARHLVALAAVAGFVAVPGAVITVGLMSASPAAADEHVPAPVRGRHGVIAGSAGILYAVTQLPFPEEAPGAGGAGASGLNDLGDVVGAGFTGSGSVGLLWRPPDYQLAPAQFLFPTD